MDNYNGYNNTTGGNNANNNNSGNSAYGAYNTGAYGANGTGGGTNGNAYRAYTEYSYGAQNTQNAQNPRNAQNTPGGMGMGGQNEFSYEPKKKKKGKTALNAILAVLCVCAIGASSIVGYSLVSGNTGIFSSDSESSSRTSIKQSGSDTNAAEQSQSTRDTSNLPTIEELATPDDALSIPEIVTKVSPSVVGISCITDGSQVSGTGIIMSEDGYIITNAHVVEGASAISVVITDSTTETEETADDSSKSVAEQIVENQNKNSEDENNITAELIGMDTQTDLAVLKIDKTGLTAAEFGTSDDLQVGEIAIVIGNPLGFDLANTVTSGIISATDRTLTIEDRTMNLIQTDASINSGNSGGPLINAYGQVIGITSAKVSSTYGEGLGFAIPISEAKEIINDLIEYGYVKGRPTLGISGENISSFYAQYYDVPQGFIVRTVESGSAAEEAGIEVNDIVVGIEGQLISTIEEFNEIKSGYKAGDTISVSVYRDNNIVDLDVTLGEAKDTSTSGSSEQQGGYEDYYGGYGDYGYGYDDFYNYYYGNR